MLYQSRAHSAYVTRSEISQFTFRQVEHHTCTGMFLLLAHHWSDVQRTCAGTLAICEHMETRDGKRIHKGSRSLEQLGRFTPGTHYQIHTYKGIRHGPAYALHLVAEQRGVIATAHELEYFVTAVLQRNMEMWHEATRRSHEIDYLVSEQIRLDRGYSVTLYDVNAFERTTQIKESLAGALAEVTDVDTGYHYLLAPLSGHTLGLFHHLGYGT